MQKKNDKKKLVYYAVDANGQKTTTETTTKTSYPVMIDNDNILSIMKAKKAYDDLGVKNKVAQELVDLSTLNVLLEKFNHRLQEWRLLKQHLILSDNRNRLFCRAYENCYRTIC